MWSLCGLTITLVQEIKDENTKKTYENIHVPTNGGVVTIYLCEDCWNLVLLTVLLNTIMAWKNASWSIWYTRDTLIWQFWSKTENSGCTWTKTETENYIFFHIYKTLVYIIGYTCGQKCVGCHMLACPIMVKIGQHPFTSYIAGHSVCVCTLS